MWTIHGSVHYAFLPGEFVSHEDSQYSWKIAECEDKYNHQ